MTHSELLHTLQKVFPLEKPLGNSLFYTRKDYLGYEGNLLETEIGGNRWDQFVGIGGRSKLTQIFGVNKQFSFLTPLGFSYYLPAFLLYMLVERDYDFLQFCLFNMYPSESETSLNRVGTLYGFLDEQQIEVIKKALLLISDQWIDWGVEENDAKKALVEYWSFM